MKVFIVHRVYGIDTDSSTTGTVWKSKIYRIFKTKEKAEEFIKERSWWNIPSITEMDVYE